MKQGQIERAYTVVELSEATAQLKLWRMQTQTRRAEELATKATIRSRGAKRASEAK